MGANVRVVSRKCVHPRHPFIHPAPPRKRHRLGRGGSLLSADATTFLANAAARSGNPLTKASPRMYSAAKHAPLEVRGVTGWVHNGFIARSPRSSIHAAAETARLAAEVLGFVRRVPGRRFWPTSLPAPATRMVTIHGRSPASSQRAADAEAA
jgi:hypothetical protein